MAKTPCSTRIRATHRPRGRRSTASRRRKGPRDPDPRRAGGRPQAPARPRHQGGQGARARPSSPTQREKARVGMAAGDPKYLPARDQGPQRKFVRDCVDGGWHLGEAVMPAMVRRHPRDVHPDRRGAVLLVRRPLDLHPLRRRRHGDHLDPRQAHGEGEVRRRQDREGPRLVRARCASSRCASCACRSRRSSAVSTRSDAVSTRRPRRSAATRPRLICRAHSGPR